MEKSEKPEKSSQPAESIQTEEAVGSDTLAMDCAQWGSVTLVGAGPGDPGLITVAGLEKLRSADVVIYDALANPLLLEEAKQEAELINAGKRANQHRMTQDETNTMIVAKAKQGLNVVRLKGGDPYLFGRGAEEAQACGKAGLTCDVVPGVTSGIAAPAYAGIPVTHRDYASSVTFITGHEDPTKDQSAVDYNVIAKLIHTGGTVCIYMGLGRLSKIIQLLTQAGVDTATPIAVIENGTLTSQRQIRGTLADILQQVESLSIQPPAMVVIGSVAGIKDESLQSFLKRPLFGKRILIARARSQASTLAQRLLELGADVFVSPAIKIEPVIDNRAIDILFSRLDQYQWIVFTSTNGVAQWVHQLQLRGLDARAMGGIKIACVGKGTAGAVKKQLTIEADLLPNGTASKQLAFELMTTIQAQYATDSHTPKILLPHGDQSDLSFIESMAEVDLDIEPVLLYHTEPDVPNRELLIQKMTDQFIDAALFTSGSTAQSIVKQLGTHAQSLNQISRISIGPQTSLTLTSLGYPPTFESATPSLEGLIEATCLWAKEEINR